MFEKIKQLSKDTAIYGISTIVGRFLNFLLVPLYTNVFTTDDFGIYSNVYAYVAFLMILYVYGMDAAFMKYASMDKHDTKKIFSNGFILVTFTTIVLSTLMFLFDSSIATFMLIPDNYIYLIYYVIPILLFDSVSLIPFANLRLQRKTVKFAVIKNLNIALNLLLNIYLIIWQEMGIEAIFISNLAASALSFILLIPEIFSNLKLSMDKSTLKIMLKFGIPYLPASIAAMAVQVIDRPVVLMLTDESTLGIYQANYKLGIFMLLFVAMFQYAWQPFFLTTAKENNAKEIFAKVFTLFMIIAVSLCVVISVFISDIASIEFWNGKTLIGKQFLSGIGIVPIILLSYVFHGMYVNFMAGLYIEEKTKYFPLITGGGAIVNVISNLIFIPVFGLMGAAFATLASYMFMSIAMFFTVQKFYKIHYEYSKILKLFLILVSIALVYYYFSLSGNLSFIIQLGIVVSYFILVAILRVVSINEIQSLIKRFTK